MAADSEKTGVADILRTCPESRRGVFEIMARKAPKSRASAIKLKCFECCAWDRAEARACAIQSCALWSWNRAAWGILDDEDAGPGAG